MDLREFFDTLDLDGIKAFVREGKEENLFLDFVTVNTPDFSSRDDKCNFAKAVSGFANSSGGVVVWGVEARKAADGVDCARTLKKVPSVKRLLSRLNELSGEAVSPLVEGTQSKVVEEPDGSGYGVTLVPASDSGPHMALLGLQRYYKRSGDSFYAMEHFDLEDMFGRRKRPVIELIHQVELHPKKPQIKLGLRNRGRGSAPAPYFAFSASAPFSRWEFGLDGNGNEGLKRLPFLGTTHSYRYGADTTYVIHPGMEQWITTVALPGFGRDFPSVPTEGVTIAYEVAAEGFPLRTGTLKVTFEELTGSKN